MFVYFVYYLRVTSCMKWYLLIDSILTSNCRQVYMFTGCVPAFSCFHNLQKGGLIMLHKLLQRHKAFPCHMFSNQKYSQCIFGHFMPLVAQNIICHAIFGPGIKWPKMASGIYLRTLIFNMTFLAQNVTSRDLDLRSNFEIDLRSKCTYFDAF